MLKDLELILLDVDGTLRDTKRLRYEGIKKAFEANGLHYDLSLDETAGIYSIGRYHDKPIRILFQIAVSRANIKLADMLDKQDASLQFDKILGKYGKKEDEQLSKKIIPIYNAFSDSAEGKKLVTLYPNTKKALDLLRAKGYKIGIYTNARRISLHRDLSELGDFDVIISDEDVSKQKPDPEGIIKACAKMDIPASKTAYIGDLPADVGAAKSAHCTSIAILEGLGIKRHLEAEHPDLVFKNFYEASVFLAKQKGD